MTTLEINDCWICEKCGHCVIDDGCGFLYNAGKVRECQHCLDKLLVPTEVKPILNNAEAEQLEFNFTYSTSK